MTLSVLLLAMMMTTPDCTPWWNVDSTIYVEGDCSDSGKSFDIAYFFPDHEGFYDHAVGTAYPYNLYEELMKGRMMRTMGGRGETNFCFSTKRGMFCVPYEAKIPVPKELQ